MPFLGGQIGEIDQGGFGAGAGEFSPTDIADLALWLDASTVTGSGNLAVWSDLSGNNNDATQGTPANQPTIGTDEIIFDGSTDFMTLTSGLDRTNGYTAFVVANSPSWTATGQPSALIGGPTGSFTFRVDNSPLQVQIVRNLQAIVLGGGTAPSASTDYIFSCTTDSSGNDIYIDGVSDGSNATNPAYTADSNIIGANDTNPFDSMNGGIRDIIIYLRVLSSSEQNQVGNYLANKRGITWTDI